MEHLNLIEGQMKGNLKKFLGRKSQNVREDQEEGPRNPGKRGGKEGVTSHVKCSQVME